MAYIIRNFLGTVFSSRLTHSYPDSIQMPSASFEEPKLSIDFKSYIENEDFLVEGEVEPSSYSQVLIFRLENLIQWVKVTFRCELLRTTDEKTIKRKTSKR